MSFRDFLGKQLLDIIEWEDNTKNTLVYKFPMKDNEIQNGGKLVVRPGQAAVFVNEGQVADVFNEGTHNLETKNLPILANLKGWKYGFKSPFKSDVFFVNIKKFLALKWGTPQPIMITDPKFEQVEVRAHGTYGFRVAEPASFIRDVVSNKKVYKVDEIEEQLKQFVLTEFSQVVAKQGVTVAELSQNYGIINESMEREIADEFGELGLEVIDFTVVSITLPDEIREALRQRTNLNILGGKYETVRQLDIMENMSNKEGGSSDLANAGMGMGMGLSFGQMFSNQFQQNQQQQQQQQQQFQQQQFQQNQQQQVNNSGKSCTNCNHQLPEGAKFCNNCGTKVEEIVPQNVNKFCTNCGHKNDNNSKFCGNCGNQIG